MDLLPCELLDQLCSRLDTQSVASLCLASKEFQSIFQPHILRIKYALDRAYKYSVVHGRLELFRQVTGRGKYANMSAVCLAAKHGQTEIIKELLLNKDIYDAVISGKGAQNDNWGHPLAAAVRAGHVNAVRLLLDLPGIDLDQINMQKHKTALVRACRSLDGSEMLNMFIEHGADLRSSQLGRPVPLMEAISRGTWATITTLKEAGAADDIALNVWAEFSTNLHRRGKQQALKRLYTLAPPQLCQDPTQLWQALSSDIDLDLIKRYLSGKPDLSGDQYQGILISSVGRRALNGNGVAICQMLVDCGVRLQPSTHGPGTLEYAANNDLAIPLLEILLKAPSCPSPSTALGWVCTADAARLLISHGAHGKVRNYDGETPLLEFLRRMKITCRCLRKDMGAKREITALLLAHGADASAVAADGSNALQRVICRGGADKKMIRLLLDHGARIAPTKEDPDNFRHVLPEILHVPTAQRVEFAKWLLDEGALVDGTDLHMSTALAKAASRLDAPLIELLLQRGANVEKADRAWTRPLIHAASLALTRRHPCWAISDYNQCFIDCTKVLLDAGATVWANCVLGNRYWAGAVNTQHLQMYLDKGLLPNEIIQWNRTTRHMPLNTFDYASGTLMHYAIEKLDMEMVQCVLDAGGDPRKTNSYGRTPWQHAVRIWGSGQVFVESARASEFLDVLRESAVYLQAEEEEGEEIAAGYNSAESV